MQERMGLGWTMLLAVLIAAVPGAACTDGGARGGGEEASAPAAASEPASAAEEAPAPSGSLAQNLQDATTVARVRKALVEATDLRPFDFEPTASGGRVTLRGSVETQAQRSRAAEVARALEGVREVVNEIEAAEAPAAPEPQLADAAPPADAASRDDDAAAAAQEEETPAEEEAPAEPEPSETYHTVKSGENLWVIARQYGVSIGQIRSLNNLRSDNLQPGDRLRVK